MLTIDWKKWGVLLVAFLCLGGCAAQKISPSSPIAHLKLVSSNPGDRTTVAIKRTLTGHGIQITDKAPLVLVLDSIKYSNPFPDQLNAGVAFTTTSTLSLNFTVTTLSGKVILEKRSLSESHSLFHNANQVNTSSMDNLFLRTLSRRLANRIYYQLSATDTTETIKKAMGHKHAAKRH
jgi:outer membrane lipopolysaccharide assembly protein LptE/RlpB